MKTALTCVFHFNLFWEYIAIDNHVSSYVEEQCQILADFYNTDNEVDTEDDVEDYDDADNRRDSWHTGDTVGQTSL
jgi:hypothetical protein